MLLTLPYKKSRGSIVYLLISFTMKTEISIIMKAPQPQITVTIMIWFCASEDIFLKRTRKLSKFA